MLDSLGNWRLALLGLLMLAGYAAHIAGRRLHVPRVTLLLLVGLAAGPSVLNLVPEEVSTSWFTFVSHLALAIVGFLLGESFVGKHLKESGRRVLTVSVVETLVTALLVLAALVAVGAPVVLALLLAGIGPATAPAATLDIVRERGAKGPLTRTILGVVALDDAWGVIIFSLFLVAAEGFAGRGDPTAVIAGGLWEVAGAALVGAALALPMAWLTGKDREGEPTLVEAIGFVFLCAGLAQILHTSYLLACMVLGAVLANRATHYTRPFHAIEDVREPFLVVFFVLAGFQFELEPLLELGIVGTTYIAARAAGKVLGGKLGAKAAGAPAEVKSHVGWCLLPQAGVALGLALLAVERLPTAAGILPLIIASTVLFEVIGPLVTLRRLERAGEVSCER